MNNKSTIIFLTLFLTATFSYASVFYTNKATGKVLDVKGGRADSNTPIQQFQLNYSTSQNWRQQRAYFPPSTLISSRLNEFRYLTWKKNEVLTNNGNNMSNNFRLYLDRLLSVPNDQNQALHQFPVRLQGQRWIIEVRGNENGKDYVTIEALGAGRGNVMVLTAHQGNNTLDLTEYDGSDHQLWIVDRTIPQPPVNATVTKLCFKQFFFWRKRIKGNITWLDLSDNETGFRIYVHRTFDGKDFGPFHTIPNSTTKNFKFKGSGGSREEHCFNVHSFNEWGESLESSEDCKVANPRCQGSVEFPDPSGWRGLLIYNCFRPAREIWIHLRNITDDGPWERIKILETQLSGNSCIGEPFVYTNLIQGDVYEFQINDCILDPDDPLLPGCPVYPRTQIRAGDSDDGFYVVYEEPIRY